MTILIPDGETWLAQPVLNCLSEVRGLRIVLVSQSRFTPQRFSRFIDRYVYLNTDVSNGLEAWLALLAALVEEEKVDVILPISLSGARFAAFQNWAEQAAVAVVPLPGREALAIANHKGLFSNYLKTNGFAQPVTFLDVQPSAVEGLIAEALYPVLTKPTTGTGGRGIKRWENAAALQSYLRSTTEEVIVQSFERGTDLSSNALCLNGRIVAFTCQRAIGNKSDPYVPAGNHELINSDKAFALAQQLVAKLHCNGLVNFDFLERHETGELLVLEMNLRCWWSMYSSCQAGVNFAHLACLLAQAVHANEQNTVLQLPLVEVQAIRHVQIGFALRMWLKQLVGAERRGELKYRTSLNLLLRDPLPKLGVFAIVHMNKARSLLHVRG